MKEVGAVRGLRGCMDGSGIGGVTRGVEVIVVGRGVCIFPGSGFGGGEEAIKFGY